MSMRFNQQSLRRDQLGLTLIELFIALGLGVFLLAGILQVFIGSRQSFEVIHAQSAMQEAGRFGMTMAGTELRKSGYINPGIIDDTNGDIMAQYLANIVDGEDLFTQQWPSAGDFEEGAAVVGDTADSGLTGTAGATESLSFRLQGDPSAASTDCAGNLIPTATGDIVEMTYYVDDDNQLRCQTGGNAASPGSVVLVSGIERMKVLYGVAGATLPAVAVKYVDAASMTTADWADVVTVRLALLTVSDNSPLDADNHDYQLLGETVTKGSDRKARQVFTQTVALRNRLFE